MASFTQALIDARRSSRPFVAGTNAPKSRAEAFQVSAEVAASLKAQVIGWKAGYSPDKIPTSSPMFLAGLRESGTQWRLAPAMPLIPEVEIAIRLNRDLPLRPAKPYTREDILDATAEIMIGFELIERRLDRTTPPPFFATLSDDQGNAGFVVGQSQTIFRQITLSDLQCRFWVDGELNTDRKGGHSMGDPLLPAVDWANGQDDQLGGLRAGHIITTGSLTPTLQLTAPGRLEGELEALGRVVMDLTL